MNKILYIIILLCSMIAVKAQVVVNKPTWLEPLCSKYDLYSKIMDETNGYRLQIMYSNDKAEVMAAKTKFYQLFPSVRAYVHYEQPYYKLRVGDFKTRLDVARALDQISLSYPSTFLVKDHVKVR
jgi:SPOR domain